MQGAPLFRAAMAYMAVHLSPFTLLIQCLAPKLLPPLLPPPCLHLIPCPPHWLTTLAAPSQVTLKALMVFHRLMRECDPSFQEAMLRMAARTGSHRLLSLDRFADHATKDAWDYSAWIR